MVIICHHIWFRGGQLAELSPKFGDRDIMNPPEAVFHSAKVMKYLVEEASLQHAQTPRIHGDTSPTALKLTVLAPREFSSIIITIRVKWNIRHLRMHLFARAPPPMLRSGHK